MCSWRLSESTLTNLMGTNMWKRIEFSLRRGYLKKKLQEIVEKFLESSWVSHVKISHRLFSQCFKWVLLSNQILKSKNWKIKIDIKIGKERWLVTYRLMDFYQKSTLLCCTFLEDEFWLNSKVDKTTQGKIKMDNQNLE